ncbi:outer membrane lipoprotein carrier protein LolA [Falsiroseomonas bella]|uniref:Outer membrane lipoprotein carrier protein LolA n=1 Tax=Falsiroseomonas bella TaxID=2184016 RepID=A0A317F5P4_9PROT|nr:outer membrane lipoprotein carrier protein LolA [Falsiroseomonas bella]PWS34481.1 outer membrane lipoprotein carrier protein LolA [Falsiroseomonas bella]
MSRRRLLGAALLAALPLQPLLAQQRPQSRAAAPDRAVLAQVEAYLNGLRTLRARFLQIGQNGASAQGTAWIVRPGRMRFDYDPPEPLLLVASGGQVMMFDRELRQPTTVPASSTPLGLLLRDQIRLSGDVTVTGMERRGGFLHVSLHRTGAPAEGRLTLSFSEDPMQLRQWTVVDAQGRETRVTLYEIDTTARPDLRIFDFNDPRFLEQERR